MHQFGSATVSELEFFIRTILTQGQPVREREDGFIALQQILP
jgi:hypothetical protein